MFAKKTDVDRHVEYYSKRLQSELELNLRSLAFAKLYYNVGEYDVARRYVSNYLIAKPKSAEAHLLLGEVLEKLGRRETALEAYRTSLDIDPKQNRLILKVCELLASEEVALEPSRARYWCEQAQLLDPQHPAVFNLRERLVNAESGSPEDVRRLFLCELEHRPTDIGLRIRLLQHLLQSNQLVEAYQHVSEIEQKNLPIFATHLAWYETVAQILVRYRCEHTTNSTSIENVPCEFWMLLVSVLDRLAALCLDETLGTIKGLSECVSAIFNLDQTLTLAMERVLTGCEEKQLGYAFVTHYRAQLSLHLATLLLKQAKKDQLKYKEAANLALPLLLAAYHSPPLDLQSVWMEHAGEGARRRAQRWHREAAFRCSQSGHVLGALIYRRRAAFADRVAQLCTGNWRERTYKQLFITRDQQLKMKHSHFVTCPKFEEITPRLPDASDLLRYDEVAQLQHPDSLHHLIWIGLNLPAVNFRCSIFDGLQFSVKNLANCAAETLNVLDIQAFLYCCVFCTQSNIEEAKHLVYYNQEKPNVLPVAITEPYGTLNQTKWFACVYKVFRNECGAELSDIRVTLIKGIEVVRCAGAHGLDAQLLVMLANTFATRAKILTAPDEVEATETRAELYWKTALPLLEKLRANQAITQPPKRWFEYRGKELTPTEISLHLEDGKLFSAVQLMKKKDHERALQMLDSLKSPYASFYQAQTYKLLADEQMSHNREHVTSEMRSQHVILLSRARDCLYLTLDRLREPGMDRKHPLNSELGTEIEKIERLLSRIDPDVGLNRNECDGMSDENLSSVGSVGEQVYTLPSSYHNGTGVGTPRVEPAINLTSTPYRGLDLGLLQQTRRVEARPSPERLDAQLRQMAAAKDATVSHMLEQNRLVMEAHRTLVEEIRGFRDAVTGLTSSVDELRCIKKSVEELKTAVDDLQNLKEAVNDLQNMKEAVEQVYEIKKELAELRKDTSKLKSNQLNEEDLYALEEEYGVDYNINAAAAAAAAAAPGGFSTAMYPNFPQRLQPYGAPGLYGMYPMYPYGGLTLGQPGALPFAEGHVPDFRLHTGLPQNQPALSNMFSKLPSETGNFNKFDTPLLPQPPATQSLFPGISAAPTTSSVPLSSKAPPGNVVITSSDPLPTTSVVQPVLSVTIPPQHLKSNQKTTQPHNYQIPLPSTAQPTFSNVPSSTTIAPMPVSTQNLLSNVAPPVYSSLTVISSNVFQPQNDPLIPDLTKTTNLKTDSGSLKIDNITPTNFSLDSSGLRPHSGNLGTDAGSLRHDQANLPPGSALNRSNVSESSFLEEHDPCPDFKPIIPLPDEVPLTTGEESERVLFGEHAKLFRFVDKEWRERGIGVMKILHNEASGKVRVLMRRDQVHKLCANHFLTPDMQLTPMPKNERAYIWAANDFADANVVLEKLCVRFKTAEEARKFAEMFEQAKTLLGKEVEAGTKSASKPKLTSSEAGNILGGFVFTTPPTFKPKLDQKEPGEKQVASSGPKLSPFAGFSFGAPKGDKSSASEFKPVQKHQIEGPGSTEGLISPKPVVKPVIPGGVDEEDVDFVPTTEFKPVITLPDLVEVKTGEENSEVIFEVKAKLLRFDIGAKEWKERGVGIMKILKDNNTIRLVMRREQVHKVCCNHQLLKSMVFTNMPKNNRVLNWCAQDFADNIIKTEMFAIRFRTPELCEEFLRMIHKAQNLLDSSNNVAGTTAIHSGPKLSTPGWGERFKPKEGSWSCNSCLITNDSSTDNCIACNASRSGDSAQSPQKFKPSPAPPPPAWSDKSKPKIGTWSCKVCFIHNDGKKNYCEACDTPKNDSVPKKDTGVDPDASGQQFSFGVSQHGFGATEPTFGLSPSFASSDKPTDAADISTSSNVTSTISDGGPVGTVFARSASASSPGISAVSSSVSASFPDLSAAVAASASTNLIGGPVFAHNASTAPPGVSTVSSSVPASFLGLSTSVASSANSAVGPVGAGFGRVASALPPGISITSLSLSAAVAAVASTNSAESSGTPGTGWGSKFRRDPNTWECQMCYIVNKPENVYCVACESPKDDTVPKKEPKGLDLGTSKFSFGIPPSGPVSSATQQISAGFTFGMPPSTTSTPSLASVASTTSTGFTFGLSTVAPSNDSAPLNLASKAAFSFTLTNQSENGKLKVPAKEEFVFGSPNKHEFEFKPRSPRKTSGGDGDAESDGSGVEDECDNIYFKPVIPLPDKIEVRTGEEEEKVLYCHRAKLFRFCAGEWKERGLGDVKILKHPQNGKIRVLMRREQVLKICLNHTVSSDMVYQPKDDRTWLFLAADYSEGEISYQQFCLRFKAPETAQKFMKAIDKARQSDASEDSSSSEKETDEKKGQPKKEVEAKKTDDVDLEIVYELKVSPEEEQKALALKLPKNFYAYLKKPPCKGCIGCNDDDFIFDQPKADPKPKIDFSFGAALKSTTIAENIFGLASTVPNSKPATIFGTPTATAGIFGTPVSTVSIFSGSNSNTSFFETPKSHVSTSSASSFSFNPQNKQFSSPFSFAAASGVSPAPATQAPVFGSTLVFGQGVSGSKNDAPTLTSLLMQPPVSPGALDSSGSPEASGAPVQEHRSPLAPSKLAGALSGAPTTSSIFSKPRTTDSAPPLSQILSSSKSSPVSIFGGAPIKPEAKSDPTTAAKPELNPETKPEAKQDLKLESKPEIKSEPLQTSGSIFALSPNVQQKPKEGIFCGAAAGGFFGAAQTPGSIFGGSQPVFGGFSQGQEKSTGLFGNLSNAPSFASVAQSAAKPKEPEGNPVLDSDSNLSFAALASGTTNTFVAKIQDETKPFMFAGAGTPVFGNLKAKTSTPTSTSKNTGTGSGTGADGDKSEVGDETTAGEGDISAEGDAEEYDPHYEPIVPLPEAIVVRTGEEDEEILFNERGKLYRYSSDTKEWKERGVGQMKILHHPVNDTYRLLMRREQVHKLVLNQLITADLELQPMQLSDRSWLWAGYNYVDDGSQLEKLAVRFKNPEMSQQFHTAVTNAVDLVSLRTSSAANTSSDSAATHEQDTEPDQDQPEDEEQDQDEYASDDSDENRSILFSKRCTLSYKTDEKGEWKVLGMGVIKMSYDSDLYGGRIEMHDDSGNLLSNTIVAVNTVMKREEACCIWRSMEWKLDPAEPRIFRAQFSSEAAAQEMYYNYEECLQYAQHSEIVDTLP